MAQSLSLVGCGTDVREWDYPVTTVDGAHVPVHVKRKSPRRLGSLHTFVHFGDATTNWSVEFIVEGATHRWNGARMPVLLSLAPGRNPILGTLSGERTDFVAGTPALRFYQLEPKHEASEVPAKSYRRDVVIPNLGVGSWFEHYVPVEVIKGFPKDMHKHAGTALVSLWQAICGVSDENLPYPDRIDRTCIEELKQAAQK